MKLGPLNRTELVANYLRAESDQTLADLQEANLALRARLEEVESDRNLFQTLIDAAPDPMIVVDRTGRILLGNNAPINLFGYESQVLTRLQVTDLMPERYRVKHAMHRNDYLAHPERKAMGGHVGTVALDADGNEFLIAATLNAVETPEGVRVLCTIRRVQPAEDP